MDKRAALRKTEPHQVCDVVRFAMKLRDGGAPTNEHVMSDVWLDPADLVPSPDNARDPQPTDPSVIELGKSLEVCQLNAVQARLHPDIPDKLDLRAGARRRAACVAAGIPIRVDVYDWDDETAFAVTMAENRDREDLTVLEEAKLCQTYLARHTMEEASDFLGHSAEWIRRRACLSRLTEEAIAYGLPDWTIGYWEAFALLEPEAQRQVIKENLCYTKADELTLRNLRNYCSYHTRSLGKQGLWPMDSGIFPGGPCAECTKRKLAVGYLPGFVGKDDCDECLDKECYDKRRKAWLKTQVSGLHAKHPDAPILVDYTTRDDLKGDWATKDEYQYDTKPHGEDWRPVTVILTTGGHVRTATRYARPSVLDRDAEKAAEPKADGETLRRWKAIKKAVVALQEDLGKVERGEDSPIRLGVLADTWKRRCKFPVVDLDIVLIAVACFGQSHHADDRRWEGPRSQKADEPCFGSGASSKGVSYWQPLELLGHATSQDREREVIDGAVHHLFAGLCGTLSSRLKIETLKDHADSACEEAKTICDFLGLDWQAQYATSAGLEDTSPAPSPEPEPVTEPEDDQRQEEWARWEREVRDPAESATEGVRRIASGKAIAEYGIAPIPSGWAWHARAHNHHSRCSTPWMGPEPDRDAALAQALAFLQRHMRDGLDERGGEVVAKPADVRKVLAELEDPDFVEPEPKRPGLEG